MIYSLTTDQEHQIEAIHDEWFSQITKKQCWELERRGFVKIKGEFEVSLTKKGMDAYNMIMMIDEQENTNG